MVLALAVCVGIVGGLLLGGRLGALADLRLRGTGLFFAALGLQVVAFPKGALPWTPADRVATALWLASYAFLIGVAFLNRGVRGFGVAALGMLSNLAAVLANGGHMPALPGAMADAHVRYGGIYANSVGDAAPHLAWLVDRWGAPSWVPLANVYSVGDVLLGLGAALIVACAMAPTRPPRLPRRARPAAGGPP